MRGPHGQVVSWRTSGPVRSADAWTSPSIARSAAGRARARGASAAGPESHGPAGSSPERADARSRPAQPVQGRTVRVRQEVGGRLERRRGRHDDGTVSADRGRGLDTLVAGRRDGRGRRAVADADARARRRGVRAVGGTGVVHIVAVRPGRLVVRAVVTGEPLARRRVHEHEREEERTEAADHTRADETGYHSRLHGQESTTKQGRVQRTGSVPWAGSGPRRATVRAADRSSCGPRAEP